MNILYKFILIYLFSISICRSELSINQQNTFNKLPEGSWVIVILSLPKDSFVAYGTIEKDIMDENYFKYFDSEKNCWIIVYCYEREVAELFIAGEMS
jgi:hypothetical protein